MHIFADTEESWRKIFLYCRKHFWCLAFCVPHQCDIQGWSSVLTHNIVASINWSSTLSHALLSEFILREDSRDCWYLILDYHTKIVRGFFLFEESDFCFLFSLMTKNPIFKHDKRKPEVGLSWDLDTLHLTVFLGTNFTNIVWEFFEFSFINYTWVFFF